MTLNDFIVRTDAAARVEELQELLLRYAAQFGFGYFIMGPTSLRNAAEKEEEFDSLVARDETLGQLSNYPVAWLEHYAERRYFDHDPVYLETTRASKPFSWEELIRKTEDERSLRVMREAAGGGLRSGLGLSIYAPRGTIVGFGFSSPEAKPLLDERSRGLMHAAAFQFYMAYAALLELGPESPPASPLSEREREVLRWIAAGRTKSETAELLTVSEACVKRHCESIFRKLEVNSLAFAVCKAIRLGLIDPF